jgi:hypothetical protein
MIRFLFLTCLFSVVLLLETISAEAQTEAAPQNFFTAGLCLFTGSNYANATSFDRSASPGNRYLQHSWALPGFEEGVDCRLTLSKHLCISYGFTYQVLRYEGINNNLLSGMVYAEPYATAGFQPYPYTTSFMNAPVYLSSVFGKNAVKFSAGLGLEPALEVNNRIAVQGESPQFDYTHHVIFFGGLKLGTDIRLSKRISLIIDEGLRISSLHGAAGNPMAIFYKVGFLNAGILIHSLPK